MHKYYFSYGSGHHDTRGRNMDGYYVVIEGEDQMAARRKYIEIFGDKWAGTYDDPSVPERWGWRQLNFPYDIEDLCSQMPQIDAVKLFGTNRVRYPHTKAEASRIIERLQEDFDL